MGILTGILNALAVFLSLILICLVLIQRGKGGGLAGAFGGMGGSSAFGTKAGDVFTRVTMGVAGFWILLSMVLVVLGNQGGESAWGTDATTKVTKEAPALPGSKAAKSATAPANGAPAGTPPAASEPAPAPAGTAPAGAAPTALPAIPAEKK